MTDLLSRLQALQQKIRIGVIGVGNIGEGIIYQAEITPGIECVAIADILLDDAVAWASRLGREYSIVDNLANMHRTIQKGKLAVCCDGSLIAQSDFIDVVVDSTSSIIGGPHFALTAINHHKHIIMMNSEADLIFGPYLLEEAKRNDVVYTSADGDQHTVLKRLINEIELWGFKTVMAGNMKGYLDRYSNPTSIVQEAEKRFMDYKMCTSYTDGTKLCIEMALTANSIGGLTLVPGMCGPIVKDIYDVFQYFDFQSLWDGKKPLVDYVLGTYPPGGVFVVGYNDHPHQMKTLGWYPPRLGPGPFYVFHRPYHLGHFETMACIAEAFLDGWGLLKPDYGLITNVYAYAKKNLKTGELLDGIGGYTAFGLIENREDNITHPGLPICLAENVTLNCDIQKDKKILLENVNYQESDPSFKLYRLALEY
jgi:predicted homoserine dehydrogenase-like protein